jgi:hypothetical protein
VFIVILVFPPEKIVNYDDNDKIFFLHKPTGILGIIQ